MKGEPNWLIECLGVDDTVRLIEISGGLPLSVPSGMRNSPLALREHFNNCYGAVLAYKLVRYFGGSEIKVPLAAKWRTAFYADQGMSPREIARKLNCSYDTVLRRLRHNPNAARAVSFSSKV
jgi:hypothetical protein